MVLGVKVAVCFFAFCTHSLTLTRSRTTHVFTNIVTFGTSPISPFMRLQSRYHYTTTIVFLLVGRSGLAPIGYTDMVFCIFTAIGFSTSSANLGTLTGSGTARMFALPATRGTNAAKPTVFLCCKSLSLATLMDFLVRCRRSLPYGSKCVSVGI